FHFATAVATLLLWMLPAAYTSVSLTAIARTAPLSPDPRAVHAVPFHLAIFAAGVPLASVKDPPMKTFVPAGTMVSTAPLTPVPSALQTLPFQPAILVAAMPPADVNEPPA